MDTQTVPRIIYQVNIRPPVSIDPEAEGMSYHELVRRQRRAQEQRPRKHSMDDYGALDYTDSPPLPWSRAFWVACLIAAVLIAVDMAVKP